MSYISKITTQKKHTGRFNVYINDGTDEKYAFSVDEDVLIKYQLKKGMELDEFTQLEVLYQDTVRKAFGTAIQYLAFRMRSEKEVRDYLKQKDIEETVIQEVIHRLNHHHYLNDEEFALAFIRTQINTSDKGPRVIKEELKEKGIDHSILEKVMEEFSLELQFSKVFHLCTKAQTKKGNDSQFMYEQKLKQTLNRKGYSFTIIDEVMGEIKNTSPDQQNTEVEALLKQSDKARKKYGNDKQKIKQFLYRKGFSIDQIDEFIERMDELE
jgi:regulatory protein